MNKKYIIKENYEIEDIVKTGKKTVSKFFIIYNKESDVIYNKYCVSVSKKIGASHTRNYLKRKIKDILMKNQLDLKKKYVIILRKDVLNASYNELSEVLLKQIKGENNK